MKFIYSLLLSILSVGSFGQYCNTFFTGQFEPITQQQEDSVYYLFTLSAVYELHTTQGYRHVYKTQWYGHCTFDLLYTGGSKSNNAYAVNQMFKCTTTPVGDSDVNYTVNGTTVRLKKYDKRNLWLLMGERDVELVEANKKSEQLLEEYKTTLTQTDSAAGMEMVHKLEKMLHKASDITPYQLKGISDFFNDLRTFNADHFYANSSAKFKSQISGKDLKRYFAFIQKVYGQWVSFTVLKQSMNENLYDSTNVEKGISTYTFEVKFENNQRPLQVDLALDNTNDILEPIAGKPNEYFIKERPKTFQYINVTPNDYDPSTYLDKITAPFFENYYSGKYNIIYETASSTLKSLATKEQFVEIIQKAAGKSNKKYTYYQHSFNIDNEKGGMVSVYYITETAEGRLLMSLTYVLDTPTKPELIGINFQPI